MLRNIALGLSLLMTLALPMRALAAAAEHDAGHAAPAGQPVEHTGVAGHGEGATATSTEGGHGREHQVVEFDVATAIWVLIIFLVLLAILYPTAWKNVLAGLKQREGRIRKDIADAEAARAKAEATLREYMQQLATAEGRVKEMIAQATAQGDKLAADIRAKAVAEAEETKGRATREIDEARKAAISEIYARAADISTSIAGKILRRNINADDQRDLVRQGLEELDASQRA